MMTEKDVLLKLIDTIETTGGILREDGVILGPMADQEWLDMAYVYLDACKVVGKAPVYDDCSEDDVTNSQDD